MDNAKERATARKPDRYDARAGERAREDERSAERSGFGVRDRVLRQSWRRNIERGEQARDRFSGGPGAGMGSGSTEGRGAGDSRGAGAVRDYSGARGWRAPEDDAAIQVWSWRKTGFRATVDVVGDARRRRRDFAIRDRERLVKRRRERRPGKGRH